MTNQIETKLKGVRAKLSMTPEEKALLKVRLLKKVFPAVHSPLSGHLPVLSPWGKIYGRSFVHLVKTTPIVVLFVVLLGGGISISAEKAVPGDILYPVKTHVNEEIRSFAAVTPHAKAVLQVNLAERRLGEVEMLASQDKLNAETQTELEEAFENNAAALKKNVSALQSSGKSSAALEVSSSFESKLKAHNKILKSLEKNNDRVLGISAKVDEETSDSESKRQVLESTISTKIDARSSNFAQTKMKQADKKITEAEVLAESLTASSTMTATVKTHISNAAALYEEGKIAFEAKQYGKALIAFEGAIREADVGKMLIRANHEFRSRFEADEREDDEFESRKGATTTIKGGYEVNEKVENDDNKNSGIEGEEKTEINIRL